MASHTASKQREKKARAGWLWRRLAEQDSLTQRHKSQRQPSGDNLYTTPQRNLIPSYTFTINQAGLLVQGLRDTGSGYSHLWRQKTGRSNAAGLELTAVEGR